MFFLMYTKTFFYNQDDWADMRGFFFAFLKFFAKIWKLINENYLMKIILKLLFKYLFLLKFKKL